MTPFRVEWSAAEIEALRKRIAAYRFPPAQRTSGWEDGCEARFLQRFCKEWAGADFQALQARLNRFAQFTAQIDGVEIHFVHVVGEAEGRRPLLLSHGWPGSIREFWRVIEPLAFPSRHGGRPEDAFDVVVPSLPNFGFSAKPDETIDQVRTAALFDQLMRETLGYATYRAHGGDWGAMVTALIGLNHAESLPHGIHMTMQFPQPSAEPRTAEEKTWAEIAKKANGELGAYAALQGSKPQSLSWAVGDSPVAQAAWILERYHDWSDRRERPFEEIFSLEDLLDTVTIYVMTGAFHSSIRYYRCAVELGLRQMPAGRRVEVPTAFAIFPDPRVPQAPRSIAQSAYNVTRWREMPHGGHFAALEAPELLIEDLRDWARQI